MRQEEHKLQCACIEWMRYQYPLVTIFAIPNGANKSIAQAVKFKREGLLSGVSDLFVMLPNDTYHGLFIEMKASKGKESVSQKAFKQKAISAGYAAVVCNSLDAFMLNINLYIKNLLYL